MIVGLVSAVVCAYAGLMTSMTVRAMKCNQNDRPENAFVFYCNSTEFTDYEHGAMYYGYEARAIENMKAADLLIMGSSRVMFAFAPREGSEILSKHGIKHFLLGFGFQQTSEFPLALIKRYRLHPKVVIINADPFFIHEPRGPARGILDGSFMSWLEYSAKRDGLAMAPVLCKFVSVACKRQVPTLYREYETGRWNLLPPDQHKPFTLNTDPVSEANVEATAKVAEEFLTALPTPRECIILTGIPSPEYNPEFATLLAKRLGVKSVNAVVDNMETSDGAHMQETTAIAWQRQFLLKALPTIKKCIEAN